MRFATVCFAVVLAGCAVKTPVLDQLDVQLDSALGQPIQGYSQRLGEPAVVEPDGELTRYGWRQADNIKPCTVELWTDAQGVIRKARWAGYERSCKPLLQRLN